MPVGQPVTKMNRSVTKCDDVDYDGLRTGTVLIIARFMHFVSIVKDITKYDGTDGKKTECYNGRDRYYFCSDRTKQTRQ